MTENTATAPTPVPSPERIAFVTEVLRTGLACFTEHAAANAPGRPCAPTLTVEAAKAAYDRASSNERRRMFRSILETYHSGHVLLLAVLDAGVTTLDTALTYLTPADEPEPEADQPANDPAASAVAGE